MISGVNNLQANPGRINQPQQFEGGSEPKMAGDSVELSATVSGGDGSATVAGGNDSATISGGADGGATEVKHSKDVDVIARRMVGTEGDPSGMIVAAGTDGDDVITIKKAPNISIAVNVNGTETVYGFGDSRKLIIDGGAGNDRIVADSDVGLQLFITGGEGNDYIVGGCHGDTIVDNYGCNTIKGGDGDDTIIARGLDYKPGSGEVAPGGLGQIVGAGRVDGNVLVGGPGMDYLEGGAGSDLISGGAGNDTVYGGAGNDLIVAGKGNDYVDGGVGNDVIRSASGRNLLFGGLGDDTIRGGNERDVVVGGAGNDDLTAGSGKGKVIANDAAVVHSAGDGEVARLSPRALPQNIVLVGSDEYQARVNDDLQFISSVGIGQTMLDGIEASGMKVKIAEFVGGNRCASDATGKVNEDGTPNLGSNATVRYDEARVSSHSLSPWADRPPLVGLYHEMVHAYNAATGTMDGRAYDYDGKVVDRGVPGSEFQAVGIDNGTVKLNPEGVSENAMRDLLGLMKRESY